MRKALLAVAVATALFAVGAFAASFGVNSEDSASGTNPVASCTTGATVTFDEGFDETSNDWNVDTATVELANAATCAGGTLTLVLQDDATGEPIVFEEDALIPAAVSGVATVTFSSVDVPVASVWNAAVLVDGLFIPNQ